jgi:ATP-dependent protease ClpP protease subunit
MNDGELEYLWNSRREHWKQRFRWAAHPPETYLAVTGDISDDLARKTIAALEQAPDNPVFFTVNSPGGNISAALRLYWALRAHPAPVSAHAERVDSAAMLVRNR